MPSSPDPFGTPTSSIFSSNFPLPERQPSTTIGPAQSRYAPLRSPTPSTSPQSTLTQHHLSTAFASASTSSPHPFTLTTTTTPRRPNPNITYAETYNAYCSTQRQVQSAIEALRTSVREDTAAARAVEDLMRENERLRARAENRERMVVEMYRAAFDGGAEESVLVRMGDVVRNGDRPAGGELWRRVLRETGRGMRGGKGGDGNGGGSGGNGNRRVSMRSLVARVVDVPPRRRQG